MPVHSTRDGPNIRYLGGWYPAMSAWIFGFGICGGECLSVKYCKNSRSGPSLMLPECLIARMTRKINIYTAFLPNASVKPRYLQKLMIFNLFYNIEYISECDQSLFLNFVYGIWFTLKKKSLSNDATCPVFICLQRYRNIKNNLETS